jgi:lipoprotein-anchoring transpeptidase ErfK/SrfK
MRVAGHRVLIAEIATPRIWKVAVLTAASAIGTASRADAALYYYSDPGYYQQEPRPPHKRQSARRAAPKKNVVVKDTTIRPQMPLIIAVSIQKQQVKVYDANGFFAEAPVSTGMAGHPTPMGVFSVIEKDRYHHSNIYSGAPMPFMQRITWSGVAMHAGVLPGYPASHGCIRMPESFAIKMWGWTKMGARVVVTPGELPLPASFTHPLLPAMKVVPLPPVAETNEPVAPKADRGALDVKPDVTELELRPTVGHPNATPVTLRDQTHTADASGDGADIKATMSDAAKSGPKTDTPSTLADTANHATVAEAKTEAKSPDVAATAKPVEATPSEEKPAEAKSQPGAIAEAEPTKGEGKPEQIEAAAKPDGESARPEEAHTATAEAKPAENTAETKSEATKTDETAAPVKVADTTAETKVEPAKSEAKVDELKAEAKIETIKVETIKVETIKVETIKADAPKADALKDAAKAEPVKIDPAKAEPAKASEKPADRTKAASVSDTSPSGPKDQTRMMPAAKQPKRREGQIAVFISRRDSKLYVRQNFAPLFEVPVTIAPSDRPLGTHIFTAEVDNNDSNLLHWSVVTVPSRAAMREEPRAVRTKKGKPVEAPVEAKPTPAVDTPAEALDRITIPADAVARITDALTTGGSIIVSDQGINQGDTGEGTDFIVSLR